MPHKSWMWWLITFLATYCSVVMRPPATLPTTSFMLMHYACHRLLDSSLGRLPQPLLLHLCPLPHGGPRTSVTILKLGARKFLNSLLPCITVLCCSVSQLQTGCRAPCLQTQGGGQLCEGDLAYLLTPTTGFKTKAQGPFLVYKLTETQAILRTTAAVRGKTPVEFTVHVHRDARGTTITDVLQDLRRQAGISAPSEVRQVTPEQHTQEIVTSAAAAFVADHYINAMI
jgi:hypothetical protein